MTRFALISLAAVRLSACGTRGTTDTLYIAGNAVTSMFTNSQFGTLSTTSPYTVTVRAQLTGAPELTGPETRASAGASWARACRPARPS
jgi:hypothetical protein